MVLSPPKLSRGEEMEAQQEDNSLAPASPHPDTQPPSAGHPLIFLAAGF